MIRSLALPLLLLLAVPAAAFASPPSIFVNDVRVDGLTNQTLTGVDVTFDANGDVRISAPNYKIQTVAGDPPPATPAPIATQAAVQPAPVAPTSPPPVASPSPPVAPAPSLTTTLATTTLATTPPTPSVAAPPPVAAPPAPPPAPLPDGPSPSDTQHYYITTVQPSGRAGMAQWDIDVYVNQVFVKRFQSKEIDPEPLTDITRFLKPGENVIHFAAKKEEGAQLSTSPADYFELVLGNGELREGQVLLTRVASYRLTAAETGSPTSDKTLHLGKN